MKKYLIYAPPAAGKSYVKPLLVQRGYRVYDTDDAIPYCIPGFSWSIGADPKCIEQSMVDPVRNVLSSFDSLILLTNLTNLRDFTDGLDVPCLLWLPNQYSEMHLRRRGTSPIWDIHIRMPAQYEIYRSRADEYLSEELLRRFRGPLF